ncbi:MAG: cytochrome c oxidase subunit II [Lentimicrobiaceae bacterium]|nr:cytochrome c oxidase subunit II [Lentimicrobiaceae bacterium]
MFSGASNFVQGVDTAFVLILGISIFFLVGLTVLMLYFIWRYHHKRNPVATQIHGSNKLEILWTVIPTILVLVMFYYGYKGWFPMKNAPPDAMEVNTIARMWSWSFEYENGKTSTTLILPVDRPVKLNLIAVDILHSLYIPAFRVKQDMVPGRKDNMMWFIPQKTGTYDLFCTEYCGLRHSYMYTEVQVMSQEEFDAWYSDTTGVVVAAGEGGETMSEASQLGRKVLENKGCIACHSLDGSVVVGPSFLGLYGKKEIVETDGKEREITVDDAYIARSIYEPDADLVKGYRKGQMISYKDQVTEEDVQNIIEFLKTLKK